MKDGAIDISRRNLNYGDGLNLPGITDPLNGANSVSLAYSPANRLSQAQGPWGTLTMSYDGVGNRTQEVKVDGSGTTTTQFAYPATSNRLSSLTVNGTMARSFAYDAAGNMTSGLPMGPSYGLVYNKRNRPLRLTLNGSPLASYGYNALEQMVRRTTMAPLNPEGVTHFIYDLQGHLIAEADGDTGTIKREYIWLDDMPIAVIDGVETANPLTFFVHVDHLNRPIMMTDAAKAQVWSAVWTPWGTAQTIAGSATMNLRFPGQYFLIEQGLAYNWHRIYDPTTGRYTQPDPLGMPDGPARYAYAKNSPLRWVDPEGRGVTGLNLSLSKPQAPLQKAGILDWLFPPNSCAITKSECEEQCDAAYEANVAICKMIGNKNSRRMCYESAMETYSKCLADCRKYK